MRRVLWPLVLASAAFACGADLVVYHVSESMLKDRYEIKLSIPVFESRSPMAKQVNADIQKWVNGQRTEFLNENKKYFSVKHKLPDPKWTLQIDGKDVFCNSKAASVRMRADVYTGGVHPVYDDYVFNYALAGGKLKRIGFDDLFTDSSASRQKIADILMKKLKANGNASYVNNGDVKTISKEQLNRFVIGAKGLTFIFSLYEVGCFANGSFEIPLSFKELGSGFKKAALGLK